MSEIRSLISNAALIGLFILSVGCAPAFEGTRSEDGQANRSSTTPHTGAPALPPSATSTPVPSATPAPTVGMRTVFMASGHMARTLMSCDGGMTWINDRSQNNATRCWQSGANYMECDHTPYSGRGLDGGDGYFFANFGWGYDGSLRRTRDGVNWETLRSDGNGGGVAYYLGRLTLMWDSWFRSTDNGTTWSDVQNSPAQYLDHPLIYRAGSVFIAVGRSQGVAVSRDQGATWNWQPNFSPDWGSRFAAGNGVIVSVGGHGYSARSTDNGMTWTSQQVSAAAGQWAGLVFTGTHFEGWIDGQKFRSTDGISWTNAAISINGSVQASDFNGPVAYNPETRTYVAIPNLWDRYYASQKAYFSRDGITWSELGASAFTGGHPINDIIAAPISAGACP